MGDSMAPLVGLSGRRVTGRGLAMPVGFADAPVDAYFTEYAEAVARAGGLPVHLPLLRGEAVALAARLDALVLSGGADVGTDPLRDEVELEILRAMLAVDKPVLGICRGAQLLNVALGGTLVQDLPIDEGDAHADLSFHRAERRHQVTFVPGTLAATIYGTGISVNSFHHQAVDRPGADITIAGRAGDGVVEAIEVVGRPLLGVQWHPEALDEDPAFAWLVHEAVVRRRRDDPRADPEVVVH